MIPRTGFGVGQFLGDCGEPMNPPLQGLVRVSECFINGSGVLAPTPVSSPRQLELFSFLSLSVIGPTPGQQSVLEYPLLSLHALPALLEGCRGRPGVLPAWSLGRKCGCGGTEGISSQVSELRGSG